MFGRLKSWVAENLPRSLVLPLTRLSAFGIQRHGLDDAAHKVFAESGFHLLRKHFYLPISEEDEVSRFADRHSELVGVDINDEAVLDLLENVFQLYIEEFRRYFPLHPDEGVTGFYLINGSFMAVDAHVYYSFIRHFKPQRIVEVGAGNSTLIAAAAGQRNLETYGRAPDLTAIDPYPMLVLKQGVTGLTRLIEEKIQDVSMSTFTSLRAGDILFIDSSHVLREGGDVQLEYCEILPRLASGVLVHIHDISLPKPYPKVYFEQRLFWNEQSLLQAFLAFNSRFEVVWPGNYMLLKYPAKVCEVFAEYHQMRAAFPQSEPSSFWIRVK